ncbi:MAG: hypothetical protein HPY66_2053 [Firmicutes bacterium]|nr:hypothetical protein [Bacillota bacterium]
MASVLQLSGVGYNNTTLMATRLFPAKVIFAVMMLNERL